MQFDEDFAPPANQQSGKKEVHHRSILGITNMSTEASGQSQWPEQWATNHQRKAR
jgi:hypothetical protein